MRRDFGEKPLGVLNGICRSLANYSTRLAFPHPGDGPVGVGVQQATAERSDAQ